MQNIDLAIVIPTLNEQHYIGSLLDSIAKQTVQPKEIVVIDAYSKDKTVEEAKKRRIKLPQLKVYQIPKSTISRQRNFGVSKTKQEHILFLDADMFFSDSETLKTYYEEVLKTKPEIASAFNVPAGHYWKDKVFFTAMNILFFLSRPIWPMTTAMNIYIKREVFEKIGGFDENIRVGEDFELVQRCSKRGYKFFFLDQPRLHTSPRRFEKEGRTKFALKMIKASLQTLLFGYRNITVEYEFGKFDSSQNKSHKT
ncbi:glycosyltransferase [Candidatus Daviesbacteria bacterium]|nr:glycosyltransferase [Candidatus Daviesbacteria bacterium]